MTTIVTLRLDAEAQAWFNDLRVRYYPPERNQIAAHVTLFHALPEGGNVRAELAGVSVGTERFPVEVMGVRSLGRGVAYTLESPELMRVHGRLAGVFRDLLTAQDRQGFKPHVVVQNKVSAEAARALLAELRAGFVGRACVGVGLDLWAYLGGPWEHLETFPFPGD